MGTLRNISRKKSYENNYVYHRAMLRMHAPFRMTQGRHPLSFSPIGTETMLSSAFPLGWLQEHLESNCLGLYTCHCVSCNIIPLALTVSCPSFISHLSYISKPPQAGNEIFYPKFLFEHFHLSNLISERIRNFQKLVLILNIPFSELYHCSLKLKTHHLPLFNFPFP